MKRLPRLEFGFVSGSTSPINIKIPWTPSEKDGLFRMNYGTKEAEYDNLVCWAQTNKGERPMDKNFGLDVRRNLFNPDIVVKDVIENEARVQLKMYFSHLTIQKLEVQTSQVNTNIPNNAVRFYLKANLKKNPNVVIEVDRVIS